MFDIFKKKNKKTQGLSERENQFISNIIYTLASRYPLFKKELELGTFAWIAPNKVSGEGSFVFGINNEVWLKISDTSKSNFLIKNILFENMDKKKVVVELYTTEGLVVGFGTTEKIENIDLPSIDVSNIWEKHFISEDYTEIEHIIGFLTHEQLQKLDMIKNTFKIKINNSTYYPVQDIGDGNYLAIDKNGKVFEINHDPFEVKKVFNTIFELLESK